MYNSINKKMIFKKFITYIYNNLEKIIDKKKIIKKKKEI